MDILFIIVEMFGGLALFLYGMQSISDSMSKLTGGSLERMLGIITKNRYQAFAAGTALTALVQSSSAVTVLSVGFVNAGILSLREVFGLIVGANLGTTANTWLISLNSLQGGTLFLNLFKPSFFVPVLAFISLIMLMTAKTERSKTIATALISFCIMMTGMMLMGRTVKPLEDMPAFTGMLTKFLNPFIAFISSMAFTMIIQSSDATIGILLTIALSGKLTLGMSIPLVCGAHVGTCITALLASLGTSNNGKRTALLHLYYNLFKTVPFLLILFTVNAIHPIALLETDAGGIYIPLFSSLINIAAAMIYLPFLRFFVMLAERTIPYNDYEIQEMDNSLSMLDPVLLMNADIALSQVNKAVIKLAGTVYEAYEMLSDQKSDTEEGKAKINTLCTRAMRFSDQILNYLKNISKEKMSIKNSVYLQCYQNICVSFSRIGEVIIDIQRIYNDLLSDQKHFSEAAAKDLAVFADSVREIVNTTVMDLEVGSISLTETIKLFRQQVSMIHSRISEKHVKRLHEGICSWECSGPFMDICYSLEKIIDSCDTVAHNLTPFHESTAATSEQKREIPEEKRMEHIRNLFKDKYADLL